MGRIGINYDDVANAAIQLSQKGQLPTIERIRQQLQTGSYSTIGLLLKQWKATQAQKAKLGDAQHLPESLTTAIQQLWETMQHESQCLLEQAQKAVQLQCDNLRDELTATQNKLQQAQEQVDQRQKQNELLQQDKQALDVKYNELTLTHAALTATNTSLTEQLNDKQNRIDSLTTLNQQAQDNLAHYRTTTADARQAEITRYEHRLNEIEQRNHQLQTKWTNIVADNAQLKTLNAQLQQDKDKLGKEISSINATSKEQHQFLMKVEHQLSQEKADKLKLETSVDADNQQVSLLKEEIAKLKMQITLQEKQIASSAAEIKSLTHQNWLLNEEKKRLLTYNQTAIN